MATILLTRFEIYFVCDKYCICPEISLRFAHHNYSINNVLVQIEVWHHVGDKPLSEEIINYLSDTDMHQSNQIGYLQLWNKMR